MTRKRVTNAPSNSVDIDRHSFIRNSVSGSVACPDKGRREGRLYAATASGNELPAVQRDHFVGSSSTNAVCQFIGIPLTLKVRGGPLAGRPSDRRERLDRDVRH